MACVCDQVFFEKRLIKRVFFFFVLVLAIDFFALVSRFLRAVVFHQEDFLYARE